MRIAGPQSLVLDASVAVKWYIQEEFSVEARRFWGTGFDMNVPSFFAAECANVYLKKSLQRGEISFDRARENLTDLLATPRTTHDAADLALAALDLALERGQRKIAIYDFLYLALAIRLDCGYLTADRVFYDAIQPTPHGSRMIWVADPIGA
jgi:predicted nucleic acid-binding protein